MTINIKTIGIIAKDDSEAVKHTVRQLVDFLRQKSCEVLFDQSAEGLIENTSSVSRETLAQQSDLAIVVGGDGSLTVDGDVTLRDLNRAMDWSLPDDEATTIAGLVIHEAQTIPEVGQIFSFHGFRFEIVRRQRNQVTALRITPLPPSDS